MKVEKAVGWLEGSNGTGIIYEVSHNGGFVLATIWQDNKFHFLSLETLGQHLADGKAALTSPRPAYLSQGAFPINQDGTLTVSNPDGWERLYTAPVQEPEPTAGGDELEIPVSVSFSGTLKLKMGGVSELLKLFQ